MRCTFRPDPIGSDATAFNATTCHAAADTTNPLVVAMTDNRRLVGYAGLPFGVALDGAGLDWTTGGAVLWYGQAAATQDGVDAAQATGLPASGSETWVETAVSGPGTLTWRWKLQLATGGNSSLQFHHGTTQVASMSSTTDWTDGSLTITATGARTLRWRLLRNTSAVAAAGDAGFLDTVNYTPFVPPTATAAASITTTSFVAHWGPVAGATSYALDVSTTADFSSGTTTFSPGNVTSLLVTGRAVATTYYYRVRATGAPGTTVNSNVVSVTTESLPTPPAITLPPENRTVRAGESVTFSVTATGIPAPGYLWQRRRPGEANFTPLGNGGVYSGVTTASLTINPAELVMSGDQFRCVAANGVNPDAVSSAAVLTVTLPPTITSANHVTFMVGKAGSFTVRATGVPEPGFSVTAGALPGWATLHPDTGVISGTPPGTSGSPHVFTISAANGVGPAATQPFTLGVELPPPPVITTDPLGQSIGVGDSVTFSVIATSMVPVSYEWWKDSQPIPSSNASSYHIGSATLANAGSYTVAVTNPGGSVLSRAANLTVLPAGTRAEHAVIGRGYVPGKTVTVANTFTYTGTVAALGWELLVPAGWSYAGTGGTIPEEKPAAGATSLLEWAWIALPPSPVTFTYTLNVPANKTGEVPLAALVILRQAAPVLQMTAKPDPIVIGRAPPRHSMDTNGNGAISLFELTRVIELYNTRNGTTRTGSYIVQAGTEDGFAPGP